MDLWITKVVTLLSILLCTIFFALIPFKIVKPIFQGGEVSGPASPWRGKLTELLNCFSGGVFLSTTLLHLFPDVYAGFQEIYSYYQVTIDFPMAELTISAGFFLIIIIEHIIIRAIKQEPSEKASRPLNGSQQATGETVVGNKSYSYGIIAVAPADPEVTFSDHESNRPGRDTEAQPSYCHNHVLHTRNQASAVSSENQPLLNKAPKSDSCDIPQIHSVRSFVLLLALSVHTLFEGLALGLMKDASSVWNLFAAILIHKIVIAFSLGTQFAENVTHRVRSVVFMVLFSFVSPIGMAIGIVISEVNGGGIGTTMASTILQGLATGTFLHVTFFEILAKEISSHSSFLKIFSVLLGYTCIAVASIFSE